MLPTLGTLLDLSIAPQVKICLRELSSDGVARSPRHNEDLTTGMVEV